MTPAIDERCQDVLDALAGRDGILGSALVRRDGLPVLRAWPRASEIDTLAAMGAALMGAGEAALLEVGDRSIEAVLVVSPHRRLSVLGVDPDHLLIVAMDRDQPLDVLDATIAGALEHLQKALDEG